MFELKPIAKKNVKSALERAERYRLLNEPREAESICLDILAVDAKNQSAMTTLLLALSDQFGERVNEKYGQAREVLEGLSDEYSRHYYAGILRERRAKFSLGHGGPGSGHVAYEWLRQAMEEYELAIEVGAADSDEAVLRWNTCARIINDDPHVVHKPDDTVPCMLE